MEKINISFDLTSSDYSCDLGFEIFYNDKLLLNTEHVKARTPVAVALRAEPGEQQLRFVLKNKTADHTTVDDSGEIVKDAFLNISNFSINDIELGDILKQHCRYYHDFNGSQESVDVPFYGDLGCNGEVVFQFQSPVYYWILESIPYRKSNHA